MSSTVGIIIGIIAAVVVTVVIIIIAVVLYRRYTINKTSASDRRTSVQSTRIPSNAGVNQVPISVISPPSYSPPIPSNLNPPPYSLVEKIPRRYDPRDSNLSKSYEDAEIYTGYGYSGECNEAFDQSMDSFTDLPSMDDILMTSSKTSIPLAVAAYSNSKESKKINSNYKNSRSNQLVSYNTGSQQVSSRQDNSRDKDVRKYEQRAQTTSLSHKVNKNRQVDNIHKRESTSGDSGAETGGPQCCSSPDMCSDSLGEIKTFPSRPSRSNHGPSTSSLRSSSGDSGVEAGFKNHRVSGHKDQGLGHRDQVGKMNWVVASNVAVETDV